MNFKMQLKIKLATLVISLLQGIAMTASAGMCWWAIKNSESSDPNKCYVSMVTQQSAKQICLYGALWKEIGMVLLGIGSIQSVASLLVFIILVVNRKSETDSRRVYMYMDNEVYFRGDCYIVWVGYRLLSTLISVNCFAVLVATKAYLNLYPIVVILMGVCSLELICLAVFFGGCIYLGSVAVKIRLREKIPLCSC